MAIGLTTLQLVGTDDFIGRQQKPTVKTAKVYPRPEHRRLLSLPDDRILDYALFGPEDGRPCIFFHNEIYGDIWPLKLAQYALQKNLRIIASARPFYGRSSPYPKGVISRRQFCEDLNVLMQTLKISRAVCISQTYGSMFALAYAEKYKKQVAAMVTIAPKLPFDIPQDEQFMTGPTKFLVNVVLRNPQMLEFALKAGKLYYDRVGSLQFLQTLFTNTKPDVEIINNPENFDAIMQGFQYCEANGYLGFYHDYRHEVKYLRQEMIDLDCITYAIIGTYDLNARAKRTDRLIAEGANFRKIMAEGGGEMLFFSHPKLVVDTLVEAWENS